MKNLKVIKVDCNSVYFENSITLSSNHDQECCESHELDCSDLTIEDFKGLEFDFTGDEFFKRIEDYGIELIPIKGHSVKIPAHGWNNGYYSSDLDLVVYGKNGFSKTYDISECQEINE